MVFILHRYIFRELLKVFILAAVALTVMLSLGSVLSPVQEYGVGPRQVVHLIVYSLPITLTFVLPIAALFAASLVYGRFACDNELDACKASGVSLLSLVYPGLALAIMVAIANLILSFHVMPAFIQRADAAIKADAKQIVFRNIQRKGYYKLPPDNEYLIYADQANSHTDTLLGVIVIQLKDQSVESITIAEKAKVTFDPHKRFNIVRIEAQNAAQMGAEDEGWFSMEVASFNMEFGSLISDDIKFKKIREMKEISQNPMLFYPIEKLARQTCAQFTAELLAQDIKEKTGNDPNAAYRLRSGAQYVEFRAEHCRVLSDKHIGRVELSGEVTVVDATSSPILTFRCRKVLLVVEGDELAPTLTMELLNPRWQRADGSEGLVAGRTRIHGLLLPEAVQRVTDRFMTADVLQALNSEFITSVLKKEPGPRLASLEQKLWREQEKTLAGIRAEIHSRLVFGIGCVSMILIGIGLGIIKKDGHVLAAFGASAIPAGVLIVCIMMGRGVAKNAGAHAGSGVMWMWAGLIALSLLVVAIYRKLLKN